MGSVDVSDGGISTAIASVRDDGTDDMYAILKYDGKAKLILQKTGSGSMDEMAGELDDGEVQYVLLRVEGGRDQESKAVKFVFITWVGASVQSALSETRPRHDTSETRPRHVRDTSETRPRHCTAGVQRRARVVGSRSAGRHGLAGVRRPAAQTLPRHFRDTSVLPPLASTQALGDVAR